MNEVKPIDPKLLQVANTIDIFDIFYLTRHFINEVDNIADAYHTFVPLTEQEEQKRIVTIVSEVGHIRKHIEDALDSKDILVSDSTLSRVLDDLMKNVNAPKSMIIRKSLFIYLFTSLENLISGILFSLYRKKRDLLATLERSMSVSQLMTYATVDEAIEDLLFKELETFRRNSFVKQFALLEKRFGISLTKFENWPAFVECTQRRNLITHCNGIVSEQYLEACRAVGYPCPDDLKVRSIIRIDQTYFAHAINIIREVGMKLSQTIWRKFFPEKLNEADRFLIDYTYQLLIQQNWTLAQIIGDYSARLPQKYDDTNNRLMHINLAIAVYHLEGCKAAQKILQTLDWSACIDDFKLAVEVLNDNFDEAATLMKQIGATGKHITKEAYLDWPLFNTFRKTPQFLKAYQEIYGSDFITDIKHKVENIRVSDYQQLAITRERLQRDEN